MQINNPSADGANKILVTGGAGYIGAITARLLKEAGYEPVIFDNFENGVRDAVKGFEVVEGDLRNYTDILHALEQVKPAGVVHFAALKAAGESMTKPEEYYQNNVGGSANLFKAMVQTDVRKIVFSSTAAVYGQPQNNPIHEDDPTIPLSVYGHSKLQVEEMLEWLAQLGTIDSIRLRYFNVAGALEDGTLGEASKKMLNILPLLVNATLAKQQFVVYGDDYPTSDGTCVRDYIHVVDLARAHILALEKLVDMTGTDYFNVGLGKGFSNLEVIQMLREVSGVDVPYTIGDRREGDPAEIFADTSKIRDILGWEPQYGLREIVEHAWQWHSSNKQIYK